MTTDPLAEKLRAAQKRLAEAIYEEDVSYAMLRRARGEREKAAEEVMALQEQMIDALRVV